MNQTQVFSWDKIPGKDNGQLVEFLIKKFHIDWIELAKIEKIDNDTTIKISNGKNILLLKLNSTKTKAILEIDDGSKDEFIVKVENGELVIYYQTNYSENLNSIIENLKEDREKAKYTLLIYNDLNLVLEIAEMWANLKDAEKYLFIDILSYEFLKVIYNYDKEQIDNERLDIKEAFLTKICPIEGPGNNLVKDNVDIKKNRKIIYKKISNFDKKWVRFCLVQLDYSLKPIKPPEDFGWILSDKLITKDKIFKALKIAKLNKVNIIIFPELSFSKEWVDEIAKMSNDMIIVGGTYYYKSYNQCVIIINGDILNPPYNKCNPSIFEIPNITGRGMKSGDLIYILETEFGRFSILTCSDYTEISEEICKYNDECKGVDFIINPCCDRSISRFQWKASSDCDIFAIDVIQVNKAPEKEKFGKSCIIGREHDGVKDILINEEFRAEVDVMHKLCDVKDEAIFIADLNIKDKPLAGAQPPPQYMGRIMVSKEKIFRWEKDNWISLSKS